MLYTFWIGVPEFVPLSQSCFGGYTLGNVSNKIIDFLEQ